MNIVNVYVNKPLENPKLKELFQKRNSALSKDELEPILNALCEEIAMNAHFLSVVKMDNEPKLNGDGTATFEKDSILSFPLLSMQDETSYYPVFIDWEELGKWEWPELKETPPKTVILSFDDYASLVIDNHSAEGIIINPFSDAFAIERDLMMQLRNRKQVEQTGRTEISFEKDTTVYLGEPANYPVDMINSVNKEAKKCKNIRTMWLRLMENNGEFSHLIVVDFIGDKNQVFELIANAAFPYLKDRYLDMIPFNDSFGQSAVNGVKPFYKRRAGLFGR